MHVNLILLAALLVQTPAPDPRQSPDPQTSAAAGEIRRAEEFLERGDYQAAQPVLADLAKANPRDAHVLFDLGFTQEHNGDDAAARASYGAAIAADPRLAEPLTALGLLEARAGELAQSSRHLNQAVALPGIAPTLKARALRALARLDQATNPTQARDELANAIQISGQQPGDAELTAVLTTDPGAPGTSEATYRAAIAANPEDITATVELASLLQKQNKLAEADALLGPALAAHPADPRLVAQTATLYAAEDKTADALVLLKPLVTANNGVGANQNLFRLYAHLLLVSGDAIAAEPLYRDLAGRQPADPSLLDDLGSTLVREQKFPEAQAVLTKAVAQRAAFHDDAAWADAAGHLAFAASRNRQPEVVLRALQTRATVLPNSAATLFLEATAHDTLHQRKEAERAYRAFLAAAGGKLPDEEFEARHRLIALEHER